ncbi:MAG: GWxTD domain-containing protein, partial [Ignavibacteriaceae bacterium]
QHPIVIDSGRLLCNSVKSFLLANSGGNIPVSPLIFNLVIPISDTSIENLNVQIINNDKEIYSGNITESYLIPLGITLCEQKLAITVDSTNLLFKNFILRDVNQNLIEGKVTLKISNEEKEINEDYEQRVVWLNKPFSLMDPEKAIEYLSYIESDSVISKMLDENESDYPKILNEYWKKFDPTPETSYNEIMFEYYSRIDYASREFRSIGSVNGAKTDRGMIYIKFGKPEKIERISNPQGQIIEVWTYVNPERKFSFIDKKGTGNFTLIEE